MKYFKAPLLTLLSLLAVLSAGYSQKLLEGTEAEAVISGTEMIRYVSPRTTPDFVRFRESSRIDFDQSYGWLKKVLSFRTGDELTLEKSETDAIGMVHYYYKHYYQGIPVEHSEYKVHTAGGMVVSVNGQFYNNFTVSTSPAIGSTSAIELAKAHIGATTYKWELESEENFIKAETGDPNATFAPQPELVIISKNSDYKNLDFRLAWKMDIYAQEPMSRHDVYVDAATGEIIWKEDKICHADVNGTANTAYSGSRQIVADSYNGAYRLRESGRGNGIRTYDMNNGTSYGNSVDFTDADNNWTNPNPAIDQYAFDAHWGSEMTYDYYDQIHSRNSIDGNGFNLLNYVHYSSGYDNAFWDGQRMTYGDGGSYFTSPLTTIDIAGHEVSHGLTSFTAGLVYQNESGALNESFSDIFGVCIDKFARNTSGLNLWRMGEECTGGSGIRRMDNPGVFGDPDTYGTGNWYTGTGDNGGVHTNSGVQNFWFYLLCQGGSGNNDYGNAYNVTAIGMADAEKIAFRNLTVYLGANSDYADARFYALQAATDLFGGCSQEVISTGNAWYAVGVGTPYSSTVNAAFTTPATQFCFAPAQVTFSNASSNASSYMWYFGDGGTSTAVNPTHTYTQYGTYTVKLVANGGACGIDSVIQTNYIVVDNNLPCNVTLDPNGNNATQQSCNGTLFDSGGSNGNYQDNISTTITIAPLGASQITLNFSSFDFELNYDYLYVYDGPSVASPLIGQYTGATLPNGGTITTTGGSVTLRQYSDQLVNESGFEVDWVCTLPNTPPNSNFGASSTSTCDGNVTFTDMSTNGPTTWLWYFGDGSTSTQQNPTHTYVTNGVYTVKQVVSNNIGSDSTTFLNYVTVNRPAAPVGQDMAICNAPQSVSVSATGGGTLNWYNSPMATSPIFTGPTYVTPPLSFTTNYYVENVVSSPSQYVGPVNNNFGTGGQHNNTSVQYNTFTVTSACELVSVWVNAGASGNRTINLWDGGGILVDSRYLNIPQGSSTVYLNFSLQPGTYRIGGTQMNLYRNNAGAQYPYTLPGFLSITGSSAGAGFFYYFYNWEVQSAPCTSPRDTVTILVGTTPSANFSSVVNGLQVSFTDMSVNGSTYQWDFGDGNTSTQQDPIHTYASAGTYQVTLIVTNNGCSDTIVMDVTVTGSTGLNAEDAVITSLYPNPFSSYMQIDLQLPVGGDLQINAYNALGEKIQRIYNGTPTAGKFTATWNGTQTLPAGVYFIRVELNGKEIVRKAVKL